jgi:hypothetical protein
VSGEPQYVLEDVVSALAALYDQPTVAQIGSALEQAYAAQLAIINNPARKKTIIGSRRSGKTNVPLIQICEDQKHHPGADYAYIALTRDSAKRIVWKEFKRVNEAAGTDAVCVDSLLEARFPDGSTFIALGADRPGWMDRFRGGKYRIVVVDECGSFQIDLGEFIREVVRPTLLDWRGLLYLLGTPGKVLRGLWYDLTRNEPELRRRGYSYHRLMTEENPHMAEQLAEEMIEFREEYGDELETQPWYIREWKGLWVVDFSDNVYGFRADLHSVDAFDPTGNRWYYILGLDFGHSDATAFVVAAYSPSSPNFYVLESYRQGPRYDTPPMLVPEVGERCRMYMQKYPGLRIVGDPANKTLFSELQTRERIPAEPAIKEDKVGWIRLVNSDFSLSRIKLVKAELQPLGAELSELKKQWKDKQAGVWEEHPKLPNDCCDGFLYSYRHSYHFRYEEPQVVPQPGTIEHAEMIAQDLKRKREKAIRDRASKRLYRHSTRR